MFIALVTIEGALTPLPLAPRPLCVSLPLEAITLPAWPVDTPVHSYKDKENIFFPMFNFNCVFVATLYTELACIQSNAMSF